ncbi:hypothetical protein CS0771_11950 [Catellatospora sp. IY07-71]|uniref:hypothetical protein n=1 Tax=Catellatospora sp. IY07-71 TaxID=2728827 RepID=UPI001BB409F7|nr:hypothetical protein [Catellatospora sp. IY07-71]BCJ71651.1 hypothetical protein CS0771_11950 [Catellatospora sp. IY07-71]
MKTPVLIRRTAAVLGDGAARLQHAARGGRVRVVKLKCRSCERWVAPHDWNPATAVCEVCHPHVLAAARRRAGLSHSGGGGR